MNDDGCGELLEGFEDMAVEYCGDYSPILESYCICEKCSQITGVTK